MMNVSEWFIVIEFVNVAKYVTVQIYTNCALNNESCFFK